LASQVIEELTATLWLELTRSMDDLLFPTKFAIKGRLSAYVATGLRKFFKTAVEEPLSSLAEKFADDDDNGHYDDDQILSMRQPEAASPSPEDLLIEKEEQNRLDFEKLRAKMEEIGLCEEADYMSRLYSRARKRKKVSTRTDNKYEDRKLKGALKFILMSQQQHQD